MGRRDERNVLEQARRELAEWRARGGGKGHAMPAQLWRLATDAARHHGVGVAARTLGLEGKKLRRLVEEPVAMPMQGGLDIVRRADAAGFVEVRSVAVEREEIKPVGDVVMDLIGRDGDRVHIELRGAPSEVVVSMARAFWSRA